MLNDNHHINNELIVSIKCLVYNHAPYLRECLDGFVMQKTNFKFEAIVHDDASTDESADIIKEYAEKYPDIIIPIYEEENQYSKRDGSLSRIIAPYLRGRYIAICEGDDFWTDPYKLQKQVDYLENHPECGLIYTDCHIYNQKTNRTRVKRTHQTDKYGLLVRNDIPTLTVCFRSEIYEKYRLEMSSVISEFRMGDVPLWLYIANEAEIHHLPFISSSYRELDHSASHSQNIANQISFYESARNCKFFYYKYFNCNDEVIMNKIDASIDAHIIWQCVLLDSKDGFNQYRDRIPNIKFYSNKLYWAFSLLKISFGFFSQLYRVLNNYRYKKL